MTMYEIEFKIRHECRYGLISQKNPQCRIKVWRTGGREVIEVIPKSSHDCTVTIEDLSNLEGVTDKFVEDDRGYILSSVHHCQVEQILEECTNEFGIISMDPVTFASGWQYHRFVVFRHNHINQVLSKFQESCFMPWMLRKVSFKGFSESQMTVTTETLFADLTEKQTNAVLNAYAHGYYKIPRDADVQTIADRLDLPRTTFQEHLKKAENKIMKAIVPHIHTWHHFSGSRGVHPMIREPYQQKEVS
ncbi:MAG: helix-turn-helix domain-containing protein [Candidatus Thorarchaeota archaeon]